MSHKNDSTRKQDYLQALIKFLPVTVLKHLTEVLDGSQTKE